MIPAPEARMPLRILFIERDNEARALMADGLRRRGHDVVCAATIERAVATRNVGVVLTADDLGPHLDGPAILEALGVREGGIPALILSEQRDFTHCRRAMRCGAVDFLLRPVDVPAVAEAVEAAAANHPVGEEPSAFLRHYFQGAESHGRALRELGAFLLDGGLGPAHRARIMSAAAQVLDHLVARRGNAPLRLQAARIEESVTLHLGVTGRLALTAVQPALPFAGSSIGSSSGSSSRSSSEPSRGEESADPGTARHIVYARALAENLEHRSEPAREEVRLTFELLPVGFEEDELDLSNSDYIDPAQTDRMIAALAAAEGAGVHLVPTTMATTVGRLLAISNRNRTAEPSLWS